MGSQAYFTGLHFNKSILQSILTYAASPLGTVASRRELCNYALVSKRWKRAATTLLLDTLNDEGDAKLFERLLQAWKRRPELTLGTKHIVLRENWREGYRFGLVFFTEARKIESLTIGYPFIKADKLNNTALTASFSRLRSLSCDFSNAKILDLLYALPNLKTLRLLQHAERGWATPPRRPPFSLDSLTLVAENDNPPSPGLVEWLLSGSRATLKSLHLSTAYGVEVLRALRSLDKKVDLRHLRLERLNIWPVDMVSKPHEECEEGELESLSTLVELLPPTLVRLGMSPAALKAGGVDDLALDLLDKIQDLPELKIIDIGGRLLAPCEGRPIASTVFYERCAKEGVLVQAWQG